jgi:hypothetical protein
MGDNRSLCQKSQKVTHWLFGCDFPKFNIKKALITNLLFEKYQTTELIFFLDSYYPFNSYPKDWGGFSLSYFSMNFRSSYCFYEIKCGAFLLY